MPDLASSAVAEKPVAADFLNGNTGNDFISGSAGGDIGRSASQVGGGSLSSDGSAYILTEGSDTFTIPPGLLDTLIGGLRGLGGADSITGSESGDIISGDGGDDRIEGRGGGDLLYGGLGNDFLSGGAGQNGLFGGDGADTLQGGDNADFINGNAGDKVMKLMHGLKMGFLFVGLISSFSFGSIARAGERWPERETPGNCPVNQVCDQYATRFKPPDAWGIGGFYINLTTERSFVTIQWTATKCNGQQITGTKDISRDSTGQNYIDFPNKAPWESGVCSFRYILLNARTENGANPVWFVMNYDVDY